MRAANDVRFVRDDRLDGVEVSLTRASSHAFPDHSHDHYAIGLMDVGASWCRGRKRKDTYIPVRSPLSIRGRYTPAFLPGGPPPIA